MPEGHPSKGQHRAATINAPYAMDAAGEPSEKSPADLTVFLRQHEEPGEAFYGAPGFLFVTEVMQDPTGQTPGTWHEPERLPEPKAKPEAPAAPGGVKK